MDNQQQHAPPSAGSLDTFVSAIQDAGGDTGTPNSIPIPRNLFNRFPQLPRYLTANASIPLSLDHVAAEEEDAGAEDDDDSVESADEANELTESMIEANLERLEDLDDCVEFSEANAIKDLKDMASVPQPPSEYVPPAVKTEKGEPKFEELDNPGDWSRYCFNPSFNKSGSYISHSLPTGAVPVPLDNGVRQCAGWTFLYKDWKMQDHWKSDGLFAPIVGTIEFPTYRCMATQHNMSPEERKSRLNYKLLKTLGLSKKRLLVNDPLFFYQLLLPLCRSDRSDIPNDPRKSYYSEVMRWTQSYAHDIGLGGSYGHRFKEVMIPELVHFDGILIRDGLLGGSTDGAIYRRWQTKSPAFDPDTSSSLTHTRFLQLKRTLKLNDNKTAKKKGEKGYEPAYKYDFIFDVVCHNVRAITETASLDLCGDESSWAHQGWGEPGAGIIARIMNKPGITKGGQTVLLVDAYRCRPYSYLHRHKLHRKINDWNAAGPKEVRLIMEKIAPFIAGGGSERVLWKSKPHSTWDNHFSGCQILNWLGEEGYAATMTCRRNRLPKNVPPKYFHTEKTANGDKVARVARFQNPISAVKIQKKASVTGDPTSPDDFFTRVHVSMQSTSSTNFTTVNALNEVSNFIRIKNRGRTSTGSKRVWGIEMNDARALYLSTYGAVDTLDSMIRRCNIGYRCFKYWHAAKNHALALAVAVAYDIYKECLTETAAQEYWQLTDLERKRHKPLSFFDFRDKLSQQTCRYSPVNQYYPGDKNFRVVTAMSKESRDQAKRKKEHITTKAKSNGLISEEQYNDIKKKMKLNDTRFCGDLTKIKKHLAAKESITHKLHCAVCGKPAYSRCTICNVGLHGEGTRSKDGNRSCYMDFHCNTYFNLCKFDTPTAKGSASWTPPTPNDVAENRLALKRLEAGCMPTRKRR